MESEIVSEGERLWAQLRGYVEPRTFISPMLRGGFMGVPMISDAEIPEGEPQCNPDYAEVRLHPADFDRLKRYTERVE